MTLNEVHVDLTVVKTVHVLLLITGPIWCILCNICHISILKSI